MAKASNPSIIPRRGTMVSARRQLYHKKRVVHIRCLMSFSSCRMTPVKGRTKVKMASRIPQKMGIHEFLEVIAL